MSFSFSFDGDDFNKEEIEESLTVSAQKLTLQAHTQGSPILTPQEHKIESLLEELPPTISYSTLTFKTDNGSVRVPKRELWDIKHQLMASSSSETIKSASDICEQNVTCEDDIMRFLAADDVIQGQYEGGFKTWECSLDLTRHLLTTNYVRTFAQSAKDERKGRLDTLEVGCGTAIPSAALLLGALERPINGESHLESVTIMVQDYNFEVLQYATIPNLLLTWYMWSQSSKQGNASQWVDEGDLDYNPQLKDMFLADLQARSIQIKLFSGAWSDALKILVGEVDTLVASETIYSPATLTTFIDMLALARGECFVAAKRVYFGVGGGIEEFHRLLPRQDYESKEVYNSSDGVRRVILSVKKKS